MNEEEKKMMLEQDISYLQRNIAPDDIYLFAQNILLASYALAAELLKTVGKDNLDSLSEGIKNCLENLSDFKYMQNTNQNIEIDMDKSD